ncbi:hypothetical protein VIRA109638_02300 [Vibrio rarus]
MLNIRTNNGSINISTSILEKDNYSVLRNNCNELARVFNEKGINGDFYVETHRYENYKTYIDWNDFSVKKNDGTVIKVTFNRHTCTSMHAA